MDADTKRWIFDIAAWTAGILALVLLVTDAVADTRVTTVANSAWRAECGSCHVPYPPELLPAQSWRAIISHLDQHFGGDASVDPKARAEIGAFLEKNAGPDRASIEPTPLRIIETRWFEREHSSIHIRETSKARALADCAACHRNAANGDYGERTLRLPK